MLSGYRVFPQLKRIRWVCSCDLAAWNAAQKCQTSANGDTPGGTLKEDVTVLKNRHQTPAAQFKAIKLADSSSCPGSGED